MKQHHWTLAIIALLACALGGCQNTETNTFDLAGKSHSAITPEHRFNWWGQRHFEIQQRITEEPVDMIFVGDSITHGFERDGKDVWDQYYAPRNAVNMGYNADRTQHVLWRMQNGEIDGISPKLAVVMIGTNNSNRNDNTPEEIADGVKAICAEMRARMPKTKILILAIFPRGNSQQRKARDKAASLNDQWAKNNAANEIVAQIADNDMITYLDINDKFLDDQGNLPLDIMPDLLHPNAKGYQIWAEAIEPTVKKMMGEE